MQTIRFKLSASEQRNCSRRGACGGLAGLFPERDCDRIDGGDGGGCGRSAGVAVTMVTAACDQSGADTGCRLFHAAAGLRLDRKSTRLNSSHEWISYAVFCLKK